MSQNSDRSEKTNRPSATPLPPPAWATRSTPEEGGVTHEALSTLAPAVRNWGPNGWSFIPATISLSTVDCPVNGKWTRLTPTIQVEGGGYSPDGARELRTAIDAFLASLAADQSDRLSEAS